MAEIEIVPLEGGIYQLQLNRPEKHNALNRTLLHQLSQAIEEIQSRPHARVLLLTAHGKSFCAGLDLQESLDLGSAEEAAQAIAEAFHLLYTCPLATIAVVQGTALAGGVGLIAGCDYAFAANSVEIGFPETQRGLVAALVMALLVRQLTGRQIRELLLSGDRVSARRAVELGLLNQALPDLRVMEEALQLAKRLLATAPGAVAKTKEILRTLDIRPLETDLEIALQWHLETRHSPEAEEGIRAFVEKRAPHWTNSQ